MNYLELFKSLAEKATPMKQIKVIVEKHADGFIAYPLGMKGVVVGEGDSYDEAVADVKSAIRAHITTFGENAVPDAEE